MIRVKLTTNFYLDEFFDKETYTKYTELDLRYMLNMKFINDLQTLRTDIGKSFTINNWAIGGDNQWRGFRNPKSADYSVGSMHTFISWLPLRAVDFVCSGMSAEDIRNHILKNQDKYPTFKRLEDGVSWVHVDTKPSTVKGITQFNK